MKKNLKSLKLNKSVVSELNVENVDAIKGGGKTGPDTLCNSAAIGCVPTVNYTCVSVVFC